jgi:hypothetical protein
MEVTLGPAIAVGAVAAAAAAAVSSLHPSEAIARLEQTDSLADAANTMAPPPPLDSKAIQRIKYEYGLARKGREATFLEEEAKLPPADGNKEARRAAFDAREAGFKHTIDSVIGEAKKGESQLAAAAATEAAAADAEAATEAEWEKQGAQYAARMKKYKTEKTERLRVFNESEEGKPDDRAKQTRKEQFDENERGLIATARLEAKQARDAAQPAASAAQQRPEPPAAASAAQPEAAASAAAQPELEPAAPAAAAAASAAAAAASAAAQPAARPGVVANPLYRLPPVGSRSGEFILPPEIISSHVYDQLPPSHRELYQEIPDSTPVRYKLKSQAPSSPLRTRHSAYSGGGKRRTPKRRRGRLSRKSTFRRHRKH